MSACPSRNLLRALILSLLAHALLLLSLPRVLPFMPDAPATLLTVSMVPSEKNVGHALVPHAVTGAAARSAASIPADAHKGGAEGFAVPERFPREPAIVSATSTVVAQEGVTTPPVVAGKASSGELSGQPALESRPVSAGSPAATSSRQDSVSANEIRQYRTLLAMSAKRFKRYPALARERGWEGSVEIALDFRRLLPEPGISLAASSGRPVLDEQALEMIRQAARVTEVPERLKGKDFRVLLPVQFSLDDDR